MLATEEGALLAQVVDFQSPLAIQSRALSANLHNASVAASATPGTAETLLGNATGFESCADLIFRTLPHFDTPTQPASGRASVGVPRHPFSA